MGGSYYKKRNELAVDGDAIDRDSVMCSCSYYRLPPTAYRLSFGRAYAMISSLFPNTLPSPPAAMTTYCRPSAPR